MSHVFTLGYTIAEHMLKNNPPRTVGNQKNLSAYGELAEMVELAGDGDYLEVGVFNGTSAIVSAKVKQVMGLGGRVIGLDDFAWYSRERVVNNEQLDRTLNYFHEYGVDDRIDLVIGTTFDLPQKITERQFSSAFIDGNHWNDCPYQDFLLIAPLVTGWIMFDDDDLESVKSSINKVITGCKDWQLVKRENNCALFRKVTE